MGYYGVTAVFRNAVKPVHHLYHLDFDYFKTTSRPSTDSVGITAIELGDQVPPAADGVARISERPRRYQVVRSLVSAVALGASGAVSLGGAWLGLASPLQMMPSDFYRNPLRYLDSHHFPRPHGATATAWRVAPGWCGLGRVH